MHPNPNHTGPHAPTVSMAPSSVAPLTELSSNGSHHCVSLQSCHDQQRCGRQRCQRSRQQTPRRGRVKTKAQAIPLGGMRTVNLWLVSPPFFGREFAHCFLEEIANSLGMFNKPAVDSHGRKFWPVFGFLVACVIYRVDCIYLTIQPSKREWYLWRRDSLFF